MHNRRKARLKGEETPKHESLAFTLFEKSAEAGYAPAMKKLSYLLEQGIGCKADPAKSLYWKKRAEKAKTRSVEDLTGSPHR